MSSKRKMLSQFIIDETQIKVGSELLWLWIAIEPKTQAILRTKISRGRNMFVAERFCWT
jgi:putative transposase